MMYAFEPRRQVYLRTVQLLQEYKGSLEGLLAEAEEVASSKTRTSQQIDIDFRATVLRVEEALSFEIEQWLVLMNRPEHEVMA